MAIAMAVSTTFLSSVVLFVYLSQSIFCVRFVGPLESLKLSCGVKRKPLKCLKECFSVTLKVNLHFTFIV